MYEKYETALFLMIFLQFFFSKNVFTENGH